MKKLNKILALFMAAAAVFAVVSCVNNNGDVKNTTDAQTGEIADTTGENTAAAPGDTTETEVQTQSYEETIPERNYGGANFKILTSTQMEPYYVSDVDASDKVSAAVYKRNCAVEQRYGITIDYTTMDGNSSGGFAFSQEITNSLNAGDDGYDIVTPQVGYATALIFQESFYNLINNEYLRFEMPWWVQTINDNSAYSGKLYGVAGSFLMDKVTTMMCAFFNKAMMHDYNLDTDLYTVVEKGSWTFDLMNNYIKNVSEDVNKDGLMDENDKYGFVSCQQAIRGLMVAGDTPFVEIVDGTPSIIYMTEHTVDVFNTYFDFFNRQNSVYWKADYGMPIKVFTDNRAMFYVQNVDRASTAQMRDMKQAFGIVPLPKYTEQQKDYITTAVRWDLMYIPVNADLERASIVMENLNYESHVILLDEYWNSTAQYKFARDEKDYDMLNLIRSSVYFDFAEFYYPALGNIIFGTEILVEKNTPDIANWWAANSENYYTLLNNLYGDLTKLK